MNSVTITPVVLCGGSGTRLWPLSRSGFPKQFLCLTGANSLFQLSVERLVTFKSPDLNMSDPIVVCNDDHRFLALEQLREINQSVNSVLLEPEGRNTAPALTIAAYQAMESNKDAILVVVPADQIITQDDVFHSALEKAIHSAKDGNIVVLGICPDRPETGYGYIKAEVQGSHDAVSVAQFVEKPTIEKATEYLAQGNFYWNAGMFVLKASTWINAISKFRKDISDASALAWEKRKQDASFIRPNVELFKKIPSESIDYAVIEHCPGNADFPIKMVPLNAGWSDLGAWDAVWGALPKDADGNVAHGDVILKQSKNTFIHSSTRLVAAVGVDDLAIIETADAVLVAKRSESQHVKQIVAELSHQKREEPILHRKVHRPWGWYDSIDEAERFKVKRIQVKPGGTLSLQKHHHRAEHWIVVKGTAEVTRGSEKVLLTENQSIYIPLGEVHRLANPGTIPLEIIEVQSGSYLGEDDIVRFEDSYGRSQ